MMKAFKNLQFWRLLKIRKFKLSMMAIFHFSIVFKIIFTHTTSVSQKFQTKILELKNKVPKLRFTI